MPIYVSVRVWIRACIKFKRVRRDPIRGLKVQLYLVDGLAFRQHNTTGSFFCHWVITFLIRTASYLVKSLINSIIDNSNNKTDPWADVYSTTCVRCLPVYTSTQLYTVLYCKWLQTTARPTVNSDAKYGNITTIKMQQMSLKHNSASVLWFRTALLLGTVSIAAMHNAIYLYIGDQISDQWRRGFAEYRL